MMQRTMKGGAREMTIRVIFRLILDAVSFPSDDLLMSLLAPRI